MTRFDLCARCLSMVHSSETRYPAQLTSKTLNCFVNISMMIFVTFVLDELRKTLNAVLQIERISQPSTVNL